jgi:hypothetical protein
MREHTMYQGRPFSVFCQRGVTQPAVERGTTNEEGGKLNVPVVERSVYHPQHSHRSLTLQFAATSWDLVIGAEQSPKSRISSAVAHNVELGFSRLLLRSLILSLLISWHLQAHQAYQIPSWS